LATTQSQKKASDSKQKKGNSAAKRTTKKALTDEEIGKRKVKIPSEDLPRRTLESALPIAAVIRDTYAGKAASWPELASALGVSENNPANRYPLWTAVAYGILRREDTQYSLAETGRKILAPNYSGEREEGILKAILTPSVLSRFYQDYNGSPLPSDEHFLNVLENRYGVPRDRTVEARQIIIDNARFASIIDESGSSLILNFSLTGAPPTQRTTITTELDTDIQIEIDPDESMGLSASNLSEACFVITPLGDDSSVERKHANTIFDHLIKPVLLEFGIEAIRADKIAKPGIITKQIIEHLASCRLCIADLSFNNPNAFYELGVRQAFLLSTIQIIRKGDKIPFDVSQGRTIIIDTSDPYTIMDRFNSARAELREHVDSCLKGSTTSEDNPVATYLPGLRVSLPK
jgi:hypothetical protein